MKMIVKKRTLQWTLLLVKGYTEVQALKVNVRSQLFKVDGVL